MSTTSTAGSLQRRTRRLGVMAALSTALMLVAAVPAEAATTTRIDVTVAETLPITAGVVDADTGLGCLGGTVTTGPVAVTTRGDITRFRGTKQFDCGSGDTLEISFWARVRGCADRNVGFWLVTGGTGAYDDARGVGVLVGTYTGGDACSASGVDDRYRGIVRS